MQIITKSEAKVFVKDTDFTFFCCFSAMSKTLFFCVRDYYSVKATTYQALTDEVRDVCAANVLVSTASQFHSRLPQETYIRGNMYNFPFRQNVFSLPVMRFFSVAHFALWFLSSR